MFRLTKTVLVMGMAWLLASELNIAAAQDVHHAGIIPDSPKNFALTDTSALVEHGVKADAVEYCGRKAVRLVKQQEGQAIAVLNGTQFRDGTIEADIATKPTTPPSVRMPGFVGIAFRVRSDASHYELFYIRPGNSKSQDQAQRNHSVQYTSEPDYGWERLRRQWPFIYEAYTDLQPEQWNHIKIEVHGRQAKLFINGSPNPSLVVEGMKGEDLDGGIALWTSLGEESYFSNVKITPTKSDPIENGGEAAGTWDVTYASDAGTFTGVMKLIREGNSINGGWSGTFGENLPVRGSWRNGYIELSFSGVFPEHPETTTATLAGWIDSDSAWGRMKVEGRADGSWTATRKK